MRPRIILSAGRPAFASTKRSFTCTRSAVSASVSAHVTLDLVQEHVLITRKIQEAGTDASCGPWRSSSHAGETVKRARHAAKPPACSERQQLNASIELAGVVRSLHLRQCLGTNELAFYVHPTQGPGPACRGCRAQGAVFRPSGEISSCSPAMRTAFCKDGSCRPAFRMLRFSSW